MTSFPEGWDELVEPPGKNVRCVVSVGMLTEGWDASNVTQILGLRAFGSQLLCEQVVGRGLRRMNYDPDPTTGLLVPEYCDVFGIPFEVIPVQGTRPTTQQPPPLSTLVQALEGKKHLAVEWPRVEGFIRDVKSRLRCDVEKLHALKIEPQVEPTSVMVRTQMGWVVGQKGMNAGVGDVETMTRQQFHEEHRVQRTAFEIARRKYRGSSPVAARSPKGGQGQAVPCAEVPFSGRSSRSSTGSSRPGSTSHPRRQSRTSALAKYRDAVIDRLHHGPSSRRRTTGESRVAPPHREGIGPLGALRASSSGRRRRRRGAPSRAMSPMSCRTARGRAQSPTPSNSAPFVFSYAKNDRLDFEIPL